MTDQDRFVDGLLDRGLAAYSQAEPLAGLEERILNRLPQPRSESGWFGWRLAFAASMVTAIVVWTLWPSAAPDLPNAAQTASTTTLHEPGTISLPAPVAPVQHSQHAIARHATTTPVQAANGDGLVRQAVFPSPGTLSAEDKLLLSYLKHTPQDELLANSLPLELPLDLRNELGPEPSLGPARTEIINTK